MTASFQILSIHQSSHHPMLRSSDTEINVKYPVKRKTATYYGREMRSEAVHPL
jgi:hypothetical protein